jgi:phage terminase large subunit-like protein
LRLHSRATALLNDGRFAVLADRSTSGSPAQWGEAVVRCHDDFDADDVVVEVNFGGDMATEVVKQAAERVHQHGDRESALSFLLSFAICPKAGLKRCRCRDL